VQQSTELDSVESETCIQYLLEPVSSPSTTGGSGGGGGGGGGWSYADLVNNQATQNAGETSANHQRVLHAVQQGEQEEYVREGIKWSYVDFIDNQETLDLLEGGSGTAASLGVFPLIDEANRIARATYQARSLPHIPLPSTAPPIAAAHR